MIGTGKRKWETRRGFIFKTIRDKKFELGIKRYFTQFSLLNGYYANET